MSRQTLNCKLGSTIDTAGTRLHHWEDDHGQRVRFDLTRFTQQPPLVYLNASNMIPFRMTIMATNVDEYPTPRLKISHQQVNIRLVNVINPAEQVFNPTWIYIRDDIYHDLITQQMLILGEANWQQWMDQFIERRNNYPEQDDMVPLTMLDLIQNRDYHNYVG